MAKQQTSEIAYQNKDITSKVFAEKFVGKSLNVYGFHLPRVKEVLPTNLPVIQADELRLDNLFLLEDASLALIDYESAYKEENKVKYLNYIGRIASQYYNVYKEQLRIKILIIYTADVQENQTKDFWNLDSVTLTLQQAFLSALDSKYIKENLTRKIQNGESLSEEEMMQFIILPLTYQGEEKKNRAIKELFELSKSIKEEAVQLFLLSGILVFTDKVISEETAKRIKEWISMTKVARLFEEEKLAAIDEAVEKERKEAEKLKQLAVEKERKKAEKSKQLAIEKERKKAEKSKQLAVEKERKEAEKERKEAEKSKQLAVEKERKLAKQQALDSATALIKEGFRPEKIVEYIKNLTLEDVIKLQEKVDK